MITLSHEVKVKVTGDRRFGIANSFERAFSEQYGGSSSVVGNGSWIDDGVKWNDEFIEVSANTDNPVTVAEFQYTFRQLLNEIFESGEIAVWFALDHTAYIIEAEDIEWAFISARVQGS